MNVASDRVKSIFLQAIEQHSPQEWPVFLDQACGDDAELREGVEKLLRAQQELGSFHEPAAPFAATFDKLSVERPGSTIGPYKLLQQIGEGGMGIVFMAEQTEPVRRKVAVKVIKPGMDSKQVIARFEAERQALAMMDHVNIARVLDAGATQSGRPYFVMELVHGVPITKYCDDNHLTPRERLELFVPVCHAIQHAHQKGVIHRDLKPSNIMVTLYDGRPVAKVIDFGVAKATEQRLTERTLFTQYGTLVGTFQYMSPEQAEISALGVDTRSDIYSLGVVLYELLTGNTPLSQQQLKDAAYSEVLRMIKEEEPPKPSTRLSESGEALASISAQRKTDPARLARLVRGELDWIVMKALEKDRNRRYETANSFAADLRRYLDDEPVQACPPSATYRFGKFARRNKAALGIIALVLVFLVLMGSGIGWVVRDHAAKEFRLATEAASRRAKLNLELEHVLDDAANAHEESLTLTDNPSQWQAALNKADYILKRARGLAAQEENSIEQSVRERIELLETRLRAVRRDVAMVLWLEDARLQGLNEPAGGKYLDPARMDAAYLKAFRDDGIDLATLTVGGAAARIRERAIWQDLAGALDTWATYTQSSELKNKLLSIVRSVDSDEWRNRVRDALWAGQGGQAMLAELAKSDQVRTIPPSTLCPFAKVLLEAGLRDDAVGVLREAQLRHPNDFWINLYLAHALSQQKPPLYDQSAGFYRAALAVRPESVVALYQLGGTLAGKGRPDEAIAYFRKAIEIDFTDSHAHAALANALASLGEYDDAVGACRRAVELDPNNALMLTNLGVTLRGIVGSEDEAVACLRKAVEANPNYARAHFELATALKKIGDFDAASVSFRNALLFDPSLEAARDALAQILQEAVRRKPNDPRAFYDFGSYLAQLGRWAEAAAAFDRSVALLPTAIDEASWAEDFWSHYFAVALHAAAGDTERYRRVCRSLLQRFGGLDDPVVAERIAKACLLMNDPLSTEDFDRVQELADRAVAGTEKHVYYRFFAMAKGLAEYRAGHYDEAVQWTGRSVPNEEGTHWDATKFAVFAMAHYAIGRADAAETALDKAKAILEKMPDPTKGQPFGANYWHDWLVAQTLCREAEALLTQPGKLNGANVQVK